MEDRKAEAAGALELRTHESIRDIGEATWNALLPADAPPFLDYAWLEALEQHGCVRPERGWMPLLVTLHRGDDTIAAAPAYIKGNTEGEFVFDHGWARFAQERLRIDYYPKLIVAVPFTPATGPRLLIAPGVDVAPVEAAFVEGLAQVVDRLGLSSAHVLFPEERQARAFADAGMLHRFGLQYHWRNDGYAGFDDFLSRFSSKRRNQIRRERRELEKQGTRIEVLTGRDITEESVDAMFGFYVSTVEKFYWGRQYLNRAFFRDVCARMADRVHVVLARDAASGRPIGGAFNLLGARALYGRYWGASEERPFLHFNVCYYQGIEEAIARGLELFEPGAGGEHKLVRGFAPTVTHSTHYLADARLGEAVADFCARERDAVAEHVADAARDPVLRPRA